MRAVALNLNAAPAGLNFAAVKESSRRSGDSKCLQKGVQCASLLPFTLTPVKMPAPRPHVALHTQALFKETTDGNTHAAFGISPEGQHVSRNIYVSERIIARLHPNLTGNRVGYLTILRAVKFFSMLPWPPGVEPVRFGQLCERNCRDHWHGWDATFTTEHQVCAETLTKYQRKSLPQLVRSLRDVPDGDLVEEILFKLNFLTVPCASPFARGPTTGLQREYVWASHLSYFSQVADLRT